MPSTPRCNFIIFVQIIGIVFLHKRLYEQQCNSQAFYGCDACGNINNTHFYNTKEQFKPVLVYQHEKQVGYTVKFKSCSDDRCKKN